MRGHRLGCLALTLIAGLYPFVVWAQTSASVTPLNAISISVNLPADRSLNATDSPVSIPLASGTDLTLLHAGNVIKIDNEYLLITAVVPASPYSTVTAARAQLGSSAAAHAAQAALLRVYQMDVLLASPNTPIGAYQLKMNYDSTKLAIVAVNVFPGTGALGAPVAVNTNDPGHIILNSFNADVPFQAANPIPVARLYFTGTTSGAAAISMDVTDPPKFVDAAGHDFSSTPAGLTTTLSAASLTVTTLDALRRGRGQITSQ